MTSKIDISTVNKSFESDGYTLLSKEYKNNSTKLDYICPNGHEHSVTWGHWNTSGSRCPYCSGQGKPTIEEIKLEFEKEGYILLSNKYINSKTKLDYICVEGHRGAIKLNDWRSGVRCKECGSHKVASVLKHSYEYIKNKFEEENYVLLSSEYKNAFDRLSYVCPNNHKHYIKWNDWQQGHRCPYCAGVGKLTMDEVRESFRREGYELISDTYINSKTKLDYICSSGHLNSVKWNDWNHGVRCPICSRYNTSIKQRTDKDIIVKSFKDEHWTMDDFDYESAHQKIKCTCPNGHSQFKSWNKWQKGQRCKLCADINNSGEKCHLWKGGVSFEPYCEIWRDKEYKQDIRDRDDNRCMNPYCRSKNKDDLTIHHIDYNKKNCSPSNLITVCRSCNSKANTDRTWHKSWYQAIIKNRYIQGFRVNDNK